MTSIDAATPTSVLVQSVCQFLADQGLGQYPAPGQVYDGSAPAICEVYLPDEPNVALAVAVYGREVPVDPHEGSWVQPLQIRGRGDVNATPLAVMDLMDGVRAALNGLHHATIGSVNVARVGFVYSADLGRDANGRQEQTDNYRLVLQ